MPARHDWSSVDEPAPGSLDAATGVEPEERLPAEEPGRYRPADGPGVIGRGGIGVVLAVWDEVLQREVACKVLAGAADPAKRARFLREARATAGLQHPGIIPVYDLGERPGGLPYYTMKYVRGRTLAAAIANCRDLRERLRLLDAFVDICQAVAYAHSRGVLHRDLKPANVMVGEFGETVVLDWGLARVRGEAPTVGDVDAAASGQLTTVGAVVGTPVYMSPEQAAGGDTDERADTWSLGVVLFELLAGRPPYDGDAGAVLAAVRERGPPPLSSVCPEAPRELAAVVDKALARDPAGRYADAAALAREVEAWRAGLRVGAYEYSSLELARRFVARHRLPILVASLATLALAALGATSYLRVVAERNRARAAEGLALTRERDAVSNLADALAEKALATPETDPFAAAVYAAGALAQHEHPEARGVIARAHRRWTPSLVATVPTPVACRTVEWLGEDLACLSGDRLVLLGPDGAPRYDRVMEHPLARNELVFSADRATIALQHDGGRVSLLDARTGAIRRTLSLGAHVDPKGAAFSADGSTLFVGGRHDHEGLGILAVDTATGALRAILAPSAYPESLTRAPDGTIWAALRGAGAWPGGGHVSVAPGPLAVRANLPGEHPLYGTEWSPDGRWLAAACADGLLMVRDASDPTTPLRLGGEGGLGTVRWSPGGELLAHMREDGRILLWRAGTWTQLLGLEVHPWAWRAFAFSPDGARFAVAGEQGIAVWAVGDLPPATGLFFDNPPIGGLRVSPQGERILAAGPDGAALWDYAGELLVRLGADGWRGSWAFSPDGASLASAGLTGVRLVDVRSGDTVRVVTGGAWRDAAFGEGGRLLVALSPEGVVAAFELATGAERWRTGPDYAYVFAGPHGRAFAMKKAGGLVFLSLTDGASTPLDDEGLFFAWLSRDGRWALLTHRDGTIAVVDSASGAEVDRFAPYDGMNRRVTISDDGRYVAAGGSDTAIRIWDRRLGRVAAVLRGHRQSMQDLAFSPDAQTLVSASWGGSVRAWDLTDLHTPGAVLLERAERRSNLRLSGARLVAP